MKKSQHFALVALLVALLIRDLFNTIVLTQVAMGASDSSRVQIGQIWLSSWIGEEQFVGDFTYKPFMVLYSDDLLPEISYTRQVIMPDQWTFRLEIGEVVRHVDDTGNYQRGYTRIFNIYFSDWSGETTNGFSYALSTKNGFTISVLSRDSNGHLIMEDWNFLEGWHQMEPTG